MAAGRTSSSILLLCLLSLAVVLMATAWITHEKEEPFTISKSTAEVFLIMLMWLGLATMAGIWSPLLTNAGARRPPRRNRLRTRRTVQVISQYLPVAGIYLFGTGSVILDLLRLIQEGECAKFAGTLDEYGDPHITSGTVASGLVFGITKILFFIVQVAFLNRFSKLTIGNSSYLSNAVFTILATNLSVWVYAFLEETHGLESEHKNPTYGASRIGAQNNVTNFTMSDWMLKSDIHGVVINTSELFEECIFGNTTLAKYLDNVRPYLYPFTMEYSLLSAGLLFHMWLYKDNVNEEIGAEEDEEQLINEGNDGDDDLSYSVQITSGQRRFKRCGFTFNLGLVLTLLHVIISATLYDEQLSASILPFHYALQLLFYVLNISACLLALRLLRHTHVTLTSFSVEDILLLLSSTGLYMFRCFSLAASVRLIFADHQNNEDFDLATLPYLVSLESILNIINVALQSFLLVQANRVKAGSIVSSTSGSFFDRNAPYYIAQAMSFLAICNFGEWVMDSFVEVATIQDLKTLQGSFYGNDTWRIIKHATYPLCIFFRFHSLIHIVHILPAVMTSQI